NLKGTSQNEMLEERRKTDEQIRNLQSETTSLPGFSTYTFLDRLNAYRARIDKKNLKPMEVMNFYTNAIFRLSTLNGVAAGNVIILQPIIKNISGQKILSDIITYQGIIVSHIFLMLETKESNPQLIASVIQLRDIINSYFTEFRIKAPKERIAEIDSLLNDPDRKTASLIEENIRSTNALDTIVSSGYLWDISTSAMDKLKMVQRSMMNEASEGADEIYNREKELQIWTFIGLILILIVVISFIVFTIRVITKSIADLKDAAQKIAEGQTGIQIKVDTNDAIGSLSQSIISIDKNNLKLAKAAKAIGEGNFNVPVEPRSKEDVLGNAIVQMKNDLQIFRRSNDEKLWLQNGIAAINNALRGDKTIEAICQDTLNTLVTYIKCESGLFYISKEHSLVFAAGYAVADNEAVPQEIEFGETLIGQVAKKKDHLHLKDVPDHFFQIRSGLGTSQPKEILLLSLHADDEIEGVIEVASLYNISEATINFLKEVSNDIAIALRSAKSKLRLQELFEQTQAQAEELQSQHSELENINAELEAQAEKLQASEEELKVQQEELLQVNAELEERSRLLEEKNQLIVERNIEIQQKAEELALSTKYKSEFLANMSHELRTPLNSVLLLSRLLSENNEQNLIPEQVEYARVIQSSGQGLLSLIDEILDLSKIEAGKMELEYSNVMLQEIVNDMKALFTPMAREKNIEFAISVDPKVPSQIETDKLRLEQILKNLLSNAVKFTKEGSVSLSISSLPENSTFISISVKDTGIGIQKEKQALIFEAFQQADGSTRRKFGGTGLGLSISRELTRLLGGEIKVTSEPGKGSEFTIYLPINKIDVKENSEVARELPAPETTAQKTNRAYRIETIPENLPDDRQEIQNDDKTILIIEDDTSFAKALLDYTHQKGYKGLVAVRGDEGIELARQYKPLGILLDIKLPVKDGWEVMEELKSNPKTRHIP
ncbi:MAG TPA: ATP-binding protein, partial [Flavisolibacter sp.]|nr:ATP-binding protein [Flavisolibacter sp.]